MSESEIMRIENAVTNLAKGDDTAKEILLTFAAERLRSLTRKMLRENADVRRWEETDDVFQNAMIRLWKALDKTELKSVQHFFRLGAVQIRRELCDLARHYNGPQGQGSHYHTDGDKRGDEEDVSPRYEGVETTREPGRLALWSEFHEKIGACLPVTGGIATIRLNKQNRKNNRKYMPKNALWH